MPIDDRELLLELMVASATDSGMMVIGSLDHSFDPQGTTVVLLLAESHASLHTWPERQYIALDVFTCGDGSEPERFLASMTDALGPTTVSHRAIERGLAPADTAPLSP